MTIVSCMSDLYIVCTLFNENKEIFSNQINYVSYFSCTQIIYWLNKGVLMNDLLTWLLLGHTQFPVGENHPKRWPKHEEISHLKFKFAIGVTPSTRSPWVRAALVAASLWMSMAIVERVAETATFNVRCFGCHFICSNLTILHICEVWIADADLMNGLEILALWLRLLIHSVRCAATFMQTALTAIPTIGTAQEIRIVFAKCIIAQYWSNTIADQADLKYTVKYSQICLEQTSLMLRKSCLYRRVQKG